MVIIKCVNCGIEFEAKRKTAKYCSNRCKQQVKNAKIKSKRPLVECIICGTKFEQTQGGRKYCSYECSEIAHMHDEMNKDFTKSRIDYDDEYDDEPYDSGCDYGDY